MLMSYKIQPENKNILLFLILRYIFIITKITLLLPRLIIS